jgi:hypothetical protein
MFGQHMLLFILILLWLCAGMAGGSAARYRAGVANVFTLLGGRARSGMAAGGAAAPETEATPAPPGLDAAGWHGAT